MVIIFKQPAGPGQKFGPNAFKDQIGAEITINQDSSASKAKLLKAEIIDNGDNVEFTLEVPDSTSNIFGIFSNQHRPMSFSLRDGNLDFEPYLPPIDWGETIKAIKAESFLPPFAGIKPIDWSKIHLDDSDFAKKNLPDITFGLYLSNQEKLATLRVQVFTAMQELKGEELTEFWDLIDYVVKCGPSYGASTQNKKELSYDTRPGGADRWRSRIHHLYRSGVRRSRRIH